ncbi:hypothetical protein ACTHGU_03525 [Chitinophagaceae bacterium MMS25-I14]
MKRYLFFVLQALCCSYFCAGKDIVQFRISKPYCILNFMETLTDGSRSSGTLKQYIQNHIPSSDTAFASLVSQYKNIVLDYSYERPEYPENRHRYRSIYDLIIIAAVHADDLKMFSDRTVGILPNDSHNRLFELLYKAETYYDRIIWDSSRQATEAQVAALQQYAQKSGAIFNTLKTLYNSSWTDDEPFIVAVYPIPGKRGNTTATPHANSLCVGVLTGETAHDQRMAVVFHEICHVLYDEQSAYFQHRLEGYFNTNPSRYQSLACNFFDEGMATACGNGWAYKQLAGKEDTTEWYNNAYINGFGHALYPLVTSYLALGKTIDSVFVDNAIKLFGQTFPKSSDDYAILLNKVFFYYDAETASERQEYSNVLNKYFHVSSMNASSPLADPASINYIKNSNSTQLFVVDRNYNENTALLKNMFPEQSNYLQSGMNTDYVLSFHDARKRPVIIIGLHNPGKFEKALQKIASEKYIDSKKPYMLIN